MGALSTSAWANLRMIRCWPGQWGLYSHKKRRDQAGHTASEKKKKVKALVTQSCPTLCNSMDCSPPSSSIHGTLQARILEWIAISFSNVGGLLYHKGTILSLGLLMCLSTHTLFPSNKHFTCFTSFHLVVEFHFYTASSPGPCHRPQALMV